MDNTIQGQGYFDQLGSFQNQGTVDTNNASGGTLSIYAVPTTNTGTLEATGGGTLQIYASTVTNTGHTISADSTSNLVLNAATINGGNLTAASPAVIHGIGGTTLNGVTITSGTTYSIDGRQQQLPHRRSGQPGNDQRRVQQRRGATFMPISMPAPSTSPAAAPSTSTTPTPISGAITATRP